MKNKKVLWLSVFLMIVLFVPAAHSQDNAQAAKSDQQGGAPPTTDTQKKNVQAYIEMLRSNVRQNKAEIMGAVMLLSADDAAKFWPIYSEYDAELTKVNDHRVANIKEYADNYDEMTDAKADELIQQALAYQKQRSELFARTYDRIKQAVG